MLKIILRSLLGATIGSALGVVMYLEGNIHQGIGLAILGGMLGILLATVGLFYETTGIETFTRGFMVFLKWTAAKNHLPEKLIPLDDKNIPRKHGQAGDQDKLSERIALGLKYGPVIAFVPAILIAIFISDGPNNKPDPLILEIAKRIIIAVAFTAFAGGGYGAALGALTVRGVHRRNILLGTVCGMIFGAGLTTAVLPGAKPEPWQLYSAICGAFGYIGMIFGLFAGDNFSNDSEIETDEAQFRVDDDSLDKETAFPDEDDFSNPETMRNSMPK